MIEVIPFKAYHIDLLRAQNIQPAQVGEVSHVPATYATVPPGQSLTARDGDHILICGGIIPKHSPRHGECWALLDTQAGRHMFSLTKAVARFINMQRWMRLEAAVEAKFAPGCRWVELLGFTLEGPMPGYGLNAETYLRYGKTWHS